MIFLKALLIVVEVLSCLMLIGLVLLQKSKSEGLGMAFGAGAGESLFGARAGNVLSKATVFLGVVFMSNTLVLGILFAQAEKTVMDKVTVPVASATVMQPEPMGPVDLVDTATADPEIPLTESVPVAIETPAVEEVPVSE